MIVGYRDERGVGKLTDHIRQPGQIEPSVHRREEGHAEAAEQWQMQPIDVRVHDVEICDPLRDRLEQSGCACRKSNPDIFVMQAAEDWAAKNTSCPFYGAR